MILLATHETDIQRSLTTMCESSRLPVGIAGDVSCSIEMVRAGEVSVVLCDSELPGGGWKRMLDLLRELPTGPLLVVTAPNADRRLWAEVLNLGGYDVLAQPLDAREVQGVLLGALRAWRTAAPLTRRYGCWR